MMIAPSICQSKIEMRCCTTVVTNALSRVMSRVLVSARRVRNEFSSPTRTLQPQDMLEARLNEAATLKRLLEGMDVLYSQSDQVVTMRTGT